MKYLIAVPLLFSFSAFSLTCEERTTSILSEVSKTHPLESKLGAYLTGKKKVLILGEDHGDYTGKDELPAIYEFMKRSQPGLNCLFLEMGSDHQSDLEAHLTGQITETELARRVVTASGGGNIERRSESYAKIFKSLLAMARVSRSAGGQVFAVDSTHEENRQITAGGLDNTNERNIIMARNIKATYDQVICDYGIQVVGYYHILLRSKVRIEDTKTVQAVLNRAGLGASAFQFSGTLGHTTSPFFFDHYYFEIPEDADENDPEIQRQEREFNAREELCAKGVDAAMPSFSIISLDRSPTLLPAYQQEPSRIEYGTTYPMRDHLDGWIWIKGLGN